ncbi:MAG: trypsin-like peptidase domain-containing protein [Deltaproteobacteria bacterium]|nr:trypsin-like peptidase domain-containing protein [Deltaproteobacteria bacterium]
MIALLALVCAAPPLSAAQQSRATPVVEVVRTHADAVVAIAATHVVTESQSMFDVFEVPRAVERSTIGSGSVIHEAGYVLTNAHVVAQASELSVVLRGGRELPAHVVAAMPAEDLAVVKADLPRGVKLQAVTLGDTDDLLVGETVVAIGAPVGLQNTVTAGIVSALDREISPRRGVAFKGLIQTDAAINPGNSGGPLFNVVGQQIGVTTAIRGDAQNVGFAIPSGKVRAMLPKLLSVESRGRARLGLMLGRERDAGVLVERVDGGSPAHKAGLEAGMVLVEVGGADTPSLADALVELLEQPTGRPFTVRAVLPEGTVDSFSVTIDEPPPPDGRALARRHLGLDVGDLDPTAATRLGLRAGAGVVVKDVERGGPAARVGLASGDLITRIGPYGVRRVSDLGVLENVGVGAEVGVRVVRIGKSRVWQTEVVLLAR